MRYRLSAPYLLLVALCLAGCGGGSTSLTGGGVPAGRARIEGTVVDAVQDDRPIADAVVTLTVEPDAPGSSPLTMETRTEQDGTFVFTDVPEGQATIRVVPPPGFSGRPRTATLHVHHGYTASLAIAIEPDAPELTVVSLTVSPPEVDTTLGRPVLITARATLSNGATVHPMLVVRGGVGRINHFGRFVPLQVGTGEIEVRAGDHIRVIPVTVRLP